MTDAPPRDAVLHRAAAISLLRLPAARTLVAVAAIDAFGTGLTLPIGVLYARRTRLPEIVARASVTHRSRRGGGPGASRGTAGWRPTAGQATARDSSIEPASSSFLNQAASSSGLAWGMINPASMRLLELWFDLVRLGAWSVKSRRLGSAPYRTGPESSPIGGTRGRNVAKPVVT